MNNRASIEEVLNVHFFILSSCHRHSCCQPIDSFQHIYVTKGWGHGGSMRGLLQKINWARLANRSGKVWKMFLSPLTLFLSSCPNMQSVFTQISSLVPLLSRVLGSSSRRLLGGGRTALLPRAPTGCSSKVATGNHKHPKWSALQYYRAGVKAVVRWQILKRGYWRSVEGLRQMQDKDAADKCILQCGALYAIHAMHIAPILSDAKLTQVEGKILHLACLICRLLKIYRLRHWVQKTGCVWCRSRERCS